MFNRDDVLQTLKCSPSQYPQMLDERFPHVLKNVVLLWDSPDAGSYISNLLQPNGGRFDRDGFPDKAWQELLQLQILYGKQHRH